MSVKCQQCGKWYKVDVLVSDKIWKQIKPLNDLHTDGLLCGSCIMEMIEKMDEYKAFELREI